MTDLRTRRACLLAAGSLCLGAARAQSQKLAAPNAVEIDPLLVTAGQPSTAALRGLGGLGFQAVVYLAPWSAHDAIPEEPALLREQGIDFVQWPIDFDRPAENDFRQVSQALQRFAGRRALVHCQINLRASTMVFLHRAIVRREPPAAAYDAVLRVWTPRGPWMTLARDLLRRHGIDFEPF